MQIRVSREPGIAIGVAAIAVGTMAIDHLIGTEREPGEWEIRLGLGRRGRS